MGIRNINVLIEPDGPNREHQALVALQQALVDAHRRGEHTSGNMRRECPLCQAS